MIELRNLTKIYNQNAENQVIALDHVSFTLPETGMVFLLGKSGSGKTTMLNLLGGLDAPTEGELCIDGTSSKHFRQKDWDAYRNNYVGFVFQEYNLLDDLTIGANIALALNLQGKQSKADAEQKIATVLAQVGLSGYGNRKPSELSGGQKQRIAIARALVKNPHMILADEPTGALDSENGQQIFDLLKEISREKLVVVVSHDEEAARRYADRIIELSDGKVISDSTSCNASKITYHSNAVHIPANYQFSDEEWVTVQAYLQACLRGENPDLPEDRVPEAVSEPMVARSTVRCEFQTQASRLPLHTALHLGLQGLKQKKIRLAITSLLCVVAFILVSLSDIMLDYNWRDTLINSLYAEQPVYTTLKKEYYNDYDYMKVCLPLQSEAAVEWFNTSDDLALEHGVPGWYDGYMFTEDDLNELRAATGELVKGVYVPGGASLSIRKNFAPGYGDYAISDAGKYAPEIKGFMELEESELDDFGMTLMAGTMPAGGTNEIAITKYSYESIAMTGYTDYAGPLARYRYYTWERDSHGGRQQKTVGFLELSFDEFLNNGLDIIKRPTEEINAIYGSYAGLAIDLRDAKNVSLSVEKPEDIIGKTLFIANRNYTITGIIDTGFDTGLCDGVSKAEMQNPAAIRDIKRRSTVQEIVHERENGFACLAFVGPGTVEQIASQYPVTVSLENLSFTIANEYTSFPFTALSDKSTLERHRLASVSSSTDSKNDVYFITGEFDIYHMDTLPAIRVGSRLIQIRPAITEESFFSNPSVSLTALDNHVAYTGLEWSSKLIGSNDEGLLSPLNTYYQTVYSTLHTILLNEYAFDLLTEGRAGTYTYAISTMPKEKDAISALVDTLYDESDMFRYPLDNVLTNQLNAANGMLTNLATVFRYVGIAMIAFALGMFANFIITSIGQRKRQIGILRALGAGGTDVFSIFFTEGLLVAAISAALTCLCAIIVCFAGNAMLHSELSLQLSLFTFGLRQVGIIFGLSLGIAVVSSLIPILRIARQKPVDAIRE